MDFDLIPIVAILAWAAITLFGMHQAARRRELAHRERLAMIERGLVPTPDKDPEQFERMMGGWHPMGWDRSRAYARHRSAGIMMICVGIGVGFMMWMSAENTRTAIGIGGMIAMIGVAFLINSMLNAPRPSYPPPYQPPPPPSPTPNEPR